jgi:maltokinase
MMPGRVVRATLGDAVARVAWTDLLPGHRADGMEQPPGRATCVDALALGDGLVLAVVEDDLQETYPVPLVVSDNGVRRAAPGDGAAEALVAMLAAGSRTEGDFRITSWHRQAAAGERAVTVDQTNESVVVGNAAVVKWLLRADPGPHPAPELLSLLDEAGFTGMPLPWGALEWRPSPGAPARLLAIVVQYVPGAVDGWDWVVDEVRDAAQQGDPARAAAAGRSVGELVASFHRALASTSRPATREEAEAWRTEASADLDRALATTEGPAHDLLVEHAGAVRAVFDSLGSSAAPVMRVHGDLHVGQVLRYPSERGYSYVLTDFDGNPVVPAADRSCAQPAALDVAGMAQSFRHVGLVVRRHNPDLDAAVVGQMAATTRAAFLTSYRAALADRADLLDQRLLAPFALRQVCREFTYAATHLPRWSYVPEAALPMLLQEDHP